MISRSKWPQNVDIPKFVPVQYGEDTFIFVSNDYLKVQNIRVPLTPKDAQYVASRFDASLPKSPQIIDLIFDQADIQLTPKPMSPNAQMNSLSVIQKHNEIIEEQLKALSVNEYSEPLIAGHKKDVLDYSINRNKVAIYGWHRSNGKPIQPLSTVHHHDYMDYSHGIRLILNTYTKNGTERPIKELF